METNLNQVSSNPNPTAFNNPAFNGGAHPVAPLVELPSGVQQVHAAHNPIPPAVQDLLQLNPASRVRSILNLAATPQQDDYFAGLAQNKSLDEKSRLLAASKIHCPVRRDTLLSQLEQDSEEDNILLAAVQDQSAEANIRLNAAVKLSRDKRREEILIKFSQNRILNAAVRLEAAKCIASEALREAILGELARTLSPDYGFEAVKVMVSSREKNEALLQLARHAKIGLKYRWEMLTMLPSGLQRQEALRTLLDATKILEPSEEREAVLLALAYDHNLEIQDRIDAASELSEKKREAILEKFAKDKRLKREVRWEAVQMLPKGDKREETLEALALDPSFDESYRVSAAKNLLPGQKKQAVSYELSLKDKFDSHYRWSLATDLLPGEERETALLKLAYDRNVKGDYRVSAADELAPGDKREEALLALAKESRIAFKDRWKATSCLPEGPKKQEALAAIAQDGILDAKDRLQAANALAAGDIKKQILDSIGS